VRLKVFDAKGCRVRVLIDDVRQPNNYIGSWDGIDQNGRSVPSGTYFYSLRIPG